MKLFSKQMKIRSPFPAQSLLAVLVLVLAGCGDSGPKMISVHGKITFDGGECPAEGTIIFSPIETPAGVAKRPGSGKFSKDGAFTITSYKDRPNSGLLPGRYRVRIECISGQPPQRPGGFEEVSYIAAKYKPEELTVPEDEDDIEINYDIPLKKKR